MKKLVATILSVMFLTLPAFSAGVKVKSGTVVPLVLNSTKTSRNVVVGEQLEASVQRDILVDGVVVFKQGDRAKINVVHVKKAGFVGIPGELTVSGGEVFDTNNEVHRFDFMQSYVGEEKTWPKVMLGCGVFIILAPLALFGFVKGGQAELKDYVPIEVKTTQDFEFKQNL